MRRPERLMVVPLADTGGPRPLIASDGKNLLRTPFFAELKRQLVAIADLRVVVIDPLQAFVLADVNSSPEAAQFLWSAMAEICAATGATLLLTHHMRKDGGFVINSVDDAREAVRGTTAWSTVAGFTYALWKADDEEARTVCANAGAEFQPGTVVKGAIVKANEEADHSVRTYLREPSGLLRQLEAEIDIDSGRDRADGHPEQGTRAPEGGAVPFRRRQSVLAGTEQWRPVPGPLPGPPARDASCRRRRTCSPTG